MYIGLITPLVHLKQSQNKAVVLIEIDLESIQLCFTVMGSCGFCCDFQISRQLKHYVFFSKQTLPKVSLAEALFPLEILNRVYFLPLYFEI